MPMIYRREMQVCPRSNSYASLPFATIFFNMEPSVFDLDHQNQHLESRIVAALERLSQTFRVLLWEETKVLGISPMQIQILIFLNYHSLEKRKVSYLAGEFHLTKATISDAVKVLEQKGLVSRATEPTDSRSHTLHLTEEGLRLANQTSLFANPLLQTFRTLDAGQKIVLYNSLLQMIAQLQKAGIVSMQRMCFSCCFHEKTPNGHFCHLLLLPLTDATLRLDCPEHEPAYHF